jgi:hypothetical protein
VSQARLEARAEVATLLASQLELSKERAEFGALLPEWRALLKATAEVAAAIVSQGVPAMAKPGLMPDPALFHTVAEANTIARRLQWSAK